jgi:hypothetical protein
MIEQMEIFGGGTMELDEVRKAVNEWLKKNNGEIEIISRQLCHGYSDSVRMRAIIAIFYKKK